MRNGIKYKSIRTFFRHTYTKSLSFLLVINLFRMKLRLKVAAGAKECERGREVVKEGENVFVNTIG